MDLKDFVQNALSDIVNAVGEAQKNSKHDMRLRSHKESDQTVEFDIAVTVEDVRGGKGKAGIRVFQMIEAGGDLSQQHKNSTVSRIKFGVFVSPSTKVEDAEFEREQFRSNRSDSLPDYR